MIQKLKDIYLLINQVLFQFKFLKRYFIFKTTGYTSYSIVSAVYNVEKYLEIYFKTITSQSLHFKKHIYLIMVDDGSTDNSATIIKKWQLKYPKNIIYIKKENSGQASARNLGISYVNTSWVTFIDPDDFVDFNYFQTVDRYIKKQQTSNLSLVSCNIIYYIENKNKFLDTHSLKNRFIEKETTLNIDNLQNYIQLTVNSVFFKSNLIIKNKLQFNKNIKPNFEDGHFVNSYLLKNMDKSISFLKDAHYYYRKRQDTSSTLDDSWKSRKKYSSVLEFGYLDLFEEAKKNLNYIPIFIQRTVLYDLIWHFKFIVDHYSFITHLDAKSIQNYKKNLYKIFNYIDITTIEKFELAGINNFYKTGLLGYYKHTKLQSKTIHIDEYDAIHHELKIHYFYYEKISIIFIVDGKEVNPTVIKKRKHKFIDKLFCYEEICRVPISYSSQIEVMIDNKRATIQVNEQSIGRKINISEIKLALQDEILEPLPLIVRIHRAVALSYMVNHRFQNSWVLMDRDMQADDNAEHLYRYIMKNYPEINLIFILRKISHDWKRLKDEGFNLIAFDSIQHTFALIHAKHLISSYVNGYVVNYLPDRFYKDIIKSKFTFLQHGITKEDMSEQFNGKKIDCIITAAQREYESFVSSELYPFSPREVCLTGFPRHDSLCLEEYKHKKIIIVMPTWRTWLVGNSIVKGDKRSINNDFFISEYAEQWYSFLHSERLKQLLISKDYRLIFFPHVNIQPYLEWFNLPAWISIKTYSDISIQELFRQSSFLITDYSSVAFEMAILNKETLYFQFDKDDMFNGRHGRKKGYYSYEEDGFGPVVETKDDLLDELELMTQNDGVVSKKYLQRMQAFFEFHDTNNCQRVYKAISKMENVR